MPWADLTTSWVDAYSQIISIINKDTEETQYNSFILDNHTAQSLSICVSQTEILKDSVFSSYHIDKIPQEDLIHLRAIVLIRPTPENLTLLRGELTNPKFKDYFIFFTNRVPGEEYLERLAHADTKELVRYVGEVYIDFMPVNDTLFDLAVHQKKLKYDGDDLKDIAERLSSVLIAQGRRPVIHYIDACEQTKRLAVRLDSIFQSLKLPDSVTLRPCNLVLVDRAEDPLTPLTVNWTFQALVHEVCTVSAGRAMNVAKEGEPVEAVPFAWTMDEYAKLAFQDYGEASRMIGQMCRTKIDNRQSVMQLQGADLSAYRNFIDKMPETLRYETAVDNYFKVHGALNPAFKKKSMYEWSRWQQDVLTGAMKAGSATASFIAKLNPATEDNLEMALKAAALFAVKFQKGESEPPLKDVTKLMRELCNSGVSIRELDFISKAFNYGQNKNRFLTGGKNSQPVYPPGMVDNELMKAPPLLTKLMQALARHQQGDVQWIRGKGGAGFFQTIRDEDTVDGDACIFILGGVTFAEAATARLFNRQLGSRLMIGGNVVHNTDSFCAALSQLPNSEAVHVGELLG
ncbi:Sec1-like protein [Carpediemonas membranifera]|uniref:Sec1-like protein n=1 Tax=Carpediemonas membranifera TaxID=201153 RepID=A0A8J6E088_9EUKA|nr:Sec1-like protein [Carpediemonas membranifera]|eukprot:KAG9391838.1 Sec1-like protein [Carpediemonas membranifera]